MNRSRRPHSFSITYIRIRGVSVGLRTSHSAVIVLRFVLHSPLADRYLCRDNEVVRRLAANQSNDWIGKSQTEDHHAD